MVGVIDKESIGLKWQLEVFHLSLEGRGRQFSAETGRGAGERQTEQLSRVEEKEVEAAGAVTALTAKPQPGKMKVDLHCHTEASSDCITPVALVPEKCVKERINLQAITDHNEIKGALAMKRIVENEYDASQLTVIVGEEVSTREGEIIGLFLQSRIPGGMTPEATVKAIREQGGLVLLPHGFDPLKRWRLQPAALERIAGEIDIVETFNARISNLKWNRAAVDWAKNRSALMSAGTDAHRLVDIGTAWVEVPAAEVKTPQDLTAALEGGLPVGKWVHPSIAFILKMLERLGSRRAKV